MARLGPIGLNQLLTDIKNWVNSKLSTKSDTAHTHTAYAVKHTYTTAASAAKNWYRIANANTKQVYTGNPIHAEFILTAYNSSYDAGYSERWYVRAMVLGRNAHVTIFGSSAAPFSQCRVLYENTIADIDDNDRPAIDIYLNYVLANGTTKIEIEEVYNQGWSFVADGQLAASTVPTGFENTAVGVRGNGVERSTYSDIATYLNKPRRDITSNVTLADNNTYRSTTLNCTGTRTITLPSINSNYFWCIIKNFNAEADIITIHPSTTAVLIDGSNDDIVLRPGEFVAIHSRAANSFTIVGDNRKRTCLVGRSGEVGTDTKHWFRVAQKTLTTRYRDAFILFDVFHAGCDSNYMGRLCAHVRVDNTIGVVGNKQFTWLYRGTQLSDDDFAMTTIETSGTSVVVDIWCKRTGGYSAFEFVVVSEGFSTDSPDSPAGKWILTRARATVGDLESLDTGFTTVTNPSIVTLANSITGKASNVTGTVAIANGGTGATTRLNAVKNLTNESVGTPTHFLAITTNWDKAGYTTVAQAKTVLGITGDMGSHSDSEYVHKTGDESITGTKTFGNGTLIVDNGTGNNVHGEIKLNGTRPVYINADNSEDGLFANTACGMSIILNDSSKSIHIGGYSTNSSGRKFIKTTDKAPYLTLGTQEVGTQILVPENDTADSTFSITSTLKYASGAAAKSFTVKFKQGDDGSSGVFPVANNKTDLGLSGNRWKNVYATNYYYGADAVEFSTKFVTTDTAQTITGAKTFASSPVIYNSDTTGSVPQLTFKNSKTVKGSTTETGAQLIYFADKNNAPLSMIESRVVSNGCTTLSTVAYNFNDSQNVSSSVQLIKNPTTAYYAPGEDNDISLGRASARWLGVYATNYYYGSDNVEFSNKFVTTDTDQSISGSKIFNGDNIVITQGNGYRMVCNTDGGASGYGVFQRVDGSSWYLMVTAQNDALGSWTSARPASMNLSTGVLSINGNAATATQFSANKSVTLTGDVTGTASSKAGWSVATTLANSGVTAGTYGPSADVTGSNNATILVPEITVDAKGRVTSVTNRTLTCKNNTYNVYDKMLTIQKNGTNVATFTSNSNTDVTANITVPTKVSELTNDSGYLTNHQSLSNYVTLNTAQDIEGNKNFKGLLTTIPNDTIWPVTASTTDDITYLGANAIHVEQKSSGKLTDLSNGAWSVAELGVGCFFFRINNGTDIRYKHLGQNTVNRIPVVSGANQFINDVTPNENNTYSLGTSSLRWSSCYSNAYYLGTTAFGDIVTHNASEFLTSHQSLSSCVKNNVTNNQTIKSTAITRGTAPSSAQTFGIAFSDNNNKYIGNIYGQYATDKSTYVGLYAYKGTTTSNGDNAYVRVGYDASGNVYTSAPTPATTDNSTQIATTAFVKAQGYLTSHPSITLSTNTTSTASPAHGGTFTCIDSVTQDTNGHITKVNTKTITLPSDNNTDTKVTQTVTTGNSTYPVLLCATANATETGTTTSRFSAGLTVNTRYSSIYMTNKYDTANTKGVRNTSSSPTNGVLYFRSYDATQMGTIRCESSKNGYQQIYMMANNYIKNGAIDPEGTNTTCYITVRVRDNGSKTIYTDGSWENSLTPYANNTHSLGTSSLQWKNAYAVNFYENGTALSSKYVQINSLAGGKVAGSLTHSIGSLVLARCSHTAFASVKLYANVAGLQLYPCRTEIYTAFNAHGTQLVPIVVRSDNDSNLGSGTWRYLGGTSTDFNTQDHGGGEVYGMFLRVA